MATAADFVAALNRKDRAAGVEIARTLLIQGAPLGDQWASISRFAMRSGEWSLAEAALRRAIDPRTPRLDHLLQLADILASSGRLTDAVDLIRPLAERVGDDARVRHLLGTTLIQLGRADEGLEQLEAAARLWPASGMTWLAIAGARRYRNGEPELDRLRDAARHFKDAEPEVRAPYLYALGKALDDAGETDAAFGAFAEGAALIRPTRAYDPAADHAFAREIVASQDGGWLETARLRDGAGLPPIFVTGLPRSGTTLVEQMLASHSAVGDGGELNLLGLAAELAGGSNPRKMRESFSGAPSHWLPAREHYFHLLRERVPGDGRAIDKSLNSSRFGGLIRLALPDAPILWLRRDPLDTAWSIFRTYFAQGLGWSFDLADIGRHMAAEDLLFEHWRTALGSQMLVVPYEALVADPDDWQPRILAHCGLAMEAGVREFHRIQRAVATASVAQVRQPLYSSAIGSAARHADRLAPFTEAYGNARRDLGLD